MKNPAAGLYRKETLSILSIILRQTAAPYRMSRDCHASIRQRLLPLLLIAYSFLGKQADHPLFLSCS